MLSHIKNNRSRKSGITRIKIIIILICLFFVSNIPAYAQTASDDIEITATFGFGGFYKAQTPTPVIVTIDNNGDLFEGWILADLQSWIPPTYYTQPVIVPPGGQQRVEMYCYGCYSQNPCEALISLLGPNGTPLKHENPATWVLGDSDSLVICLNDSPATAPNLDNLTEGINTGYLSMVANGFHPSPGIINYPPKIFPVIQKPEDLPSNAILLNGVSLITTNLATFLSMDQPTRDTIMEYVRHGGNFLIFYRHGVDPVDGWTGEPLLPVEPVSDPVTIPIDDFIESCSEIFSYDDLIQFISQRALETERGDHGELLIPGTDQSTAIGAYKPDTSQDSTGSPPDSWKPPDNYTALSVIPTVPCETVTATGFDTPFLVVRNLGGGHAAFAAFNPFEGGPTAGDEPIGLLASFSLLDPGSSTRRQVMNSTRGFRSLQDGRIENFFRQGSTAGAGWIVNWLDALGPALIYLMALPIIALIARGQGRTILALFILWSILFTLFTFFRTSKGVSDIVRMNDASLYWCEALSPEEAESDTGISGNLHTCFSYSATTPVPHTLSWEYPDTVLDEIVDVYTWSYGSITIENGISGASLPDLPLEAIAFRSRGTGERTFTLHRPAPELTAFGKLTIGPEHAHFDLDAEIPFPAVSAKLLVNSHKSLWVVKDLGSQEERIHISVNLVNDEDIRRDRSLFPDYEGELPEQTVSSVQDTGEEELGYILETFRSQVVASPVRRAQFYTQSVLQPRPQQAYIVLASTGTPSEVAVDRGELDVHSVTIMVITIPIVYE